MTHWCQVPMFAISKDHVRKDRGSFSVVLLPGQDYTVLPLELQSAPGSHLAEKVKRISGQNLIRRFTEISLEKAEREVKEIAKKHWQ